MIHLKNSLKIMLLSIAMMLCFSLLISSSVASETLTNNTLNVSELSKTLKINLSNKIKSLDISTITVYGKPSCSRGCGGYYWYKSTFINKCPFCGSSNLCDNLKGVPEKEVTCKRCDADFCSVCGGDKCSRHVFLTKT